MRGPGWTSLDSWDSCKLSARTLARVVLVLIECFVPARAFKLDRSSHGGSQSRTNYPADKTPQLFRSTDPQKTATYSQAHIGTLAIERMAMLGDTIASAKPRQPPESGDDSEATEDET